MSEKSPAEKKAAQQERGLKADENREPKAAPREPAEPRAGIQDESLERLRDEDEASAPGSPDDPAAFKRDESQERNERVDKLLSSEGTMQPFRSQSDGGLPRERLPVVRVGEVWEDVRPSEDDHRRFVKVIDASPDEDGRVLVKNEETYKESRIRLDRFTPENGWRRFAS